MNQFYSPDLAATAQRMGELAEGLAGAGHEVSVVCSRGAYDGGSGPSTMLGAGPSTSLRTPRTEVLGGVRVRRLAGFSAGKRSPLRRVLDYAAFHALAGLWVLTRGWRFDVVVTLTTPPLIGIYGAMLRAVSGGRVRHVAWAMDLHPDAEFELGMWRRGNPLWRVLDGLNAWHFRRADRVVALGECMGRRIADKRVAADRVAVIPVWHDGQHIRPMDAERSAFRARQGWGGKTVVMYSGNAGLVHTFDAVCEAMRVLREDDRFVFAFVGGGKRMAELEAFAEREGIRSFVRLGYVAEEEMSDMLAAGDVHLVTLREGMAGVAVPCKLYGIMAAGRPVVYVGDPASDTAMHIRESDAGLVHGSEDAAGLVETLRTLASDAGMRRQIGARARQAFEQRFDRAGCCEQWTELLEKVVGETHSTAGELCNAKP